MTEDKQETEFESLLIKASNLESKLEFHDVADESFSLCEEYLGFLITFDTLHEHKKQSVISKGLRFDFLGVVESIEEAVARNSKRYLKLQLQDIHGKTLSLCLFEEAAHYCSAQEFTERYLLKEQHSLLFIQTLQWDGKYLSADKLTLFENGEQHPKAAQYKQNEEYLKLKLLPKDNDHLAKAISSSCKQAKILVEKIMTFMREQHELFTLPPAKNSGVIISKITEIAYSKTYSGTSYLLQGEKQARITNEYTNYFVRQLQSILEMFVKSKKQPVLLNILTLQCILERWRREVVSLHEFERVENKAIIE